MEGSNEDNFADMVSVRRTMSWKRRANITLNIMF